MIEIEQSLQASVLPVDTATSVDVVVRKKRLVRLPSFEVLIDITCGIDGLVLLAACTVERLPFVQLALSETTDHMQLLANIFGGCVTFGILQAHKGYELPVLKSFKQQIPIIVGAVVCGGGIVYASLMFLHHHLVEEYIGALRWMFLSTAFLGISRFATSSCFRKLARKGLLAKRIALVGNNKDSEDFISKIAHDTERFRVVALYDDAATHAQAGYDNIAKHGGIDQVLADSQIHPYDAVVVTKSFDSAEEVDRVFALVFPVIADIYSSGNLRLGAKSKNDLSELGGNLAILVEPKPLKDWQVFYKALFDRIISTIALVGLSPIMVALAIIIRLDSKGPALFHQPRVGYNNLLFDVHKFRTMYDHLADHRADKQTTKDDPRITRVGRFLRKYSIDELPQLINVVKGNMSLVGPRPHAPGTKADGQLFQDIVPNYALRHRVKPGITGLAQVNGFRGQTKTVGDIQRRVEFDLHYIKTWSILSDFKILVLTILREIKSKNAF
jgi:Undecaprenyl-phosphate glucose phosphotransferase